MSRIDEIKARGYVDPDILWLIARVEGLESVVVSLHFQAIQQCRDCPDRPYPKCYPLGCGLALVRQNYDAALEELTP